MLGIITKTFMGLLININSFKISFVNYSTDYNLQPNEYSQEFHYYPFSVKLERCVRSCNTLKIYLIKYVF